eukprot:5650087-Amphidinium_carterae.1
MANHVAIGGMRDAWGALGRAGANHKQLGSRVAARMKHLLSVAPSLRTSCVSALGKNGTGDPDKRFMDFFKTELLKLFPPDEHEPMQDTDVNGELDDHFLWRWAKAAGDPDLEA